MAAGQSPSARTWAATQAERRPVCDDSAAEAACATGAMQWTLHLPYHV